MPFILRATTLSGKDTFTREHFKPHCVLSSDSFRLMLTDEIGCQMLNALVFSTLRSILEIRLQNRVSYTVINATNLKFKDCEEYITLAKKYGCPVTVISIDPPPVEELLLRNSIRIEQQVPEEVIHKHLNSYYAGLPRFQEVAEEGRIALIRIDQSHNVVESSV